MRILVVKLADLGDVLTATPALRALRNSLPEAEIDVLVTPQGQGVLTGSPYVDQVIVFPKSLFDSPAGILNPAASLEAIKLFIKLRSRRYDAVAVMHHLTTNWGAWKYAALSILSGARVRAGLDNGRGWFLTDRAPDDGFGARHEVEYCVEVAKLLGAKEDLGPLELPLSESDKAFARELLPEGGPIIAIHPGSGAYSPARRWPIEKFQALASILSERGAFLVIVGGPEEETIAAQVAQRVFGRCLNMAGVTSIKQLAALLADCGLFIGSDSGVIHVATAVGTPVVAIFGPSNHWAWGPWYGKPPTTETLVLRSDIPCSPCFYVGLGLGSRFGCPPRTCLQEISPEQVAEAAWRLISAREESGVNPWSARR